MGDGGLVLGHLEHVLLGILDRLGDRGGNLVRLAVADADAVDLVPDDDQRGEREAPSALYNLGNAVDLDDALLKLTNVSLVSGQLRTPILTRGRPRPAP
jgi:hypothetical protein